MNNLANHNYSPSATAYDHWRGKAVQVKFAFADSVKGFYKKRSSPSTLCTKKDSNTKATLKWECEFPNDLHTG